jgi:hypothetical protein
LLLSLEPNICTVVGLSTNPAPFIIISKFLNSGFYGLKACL